MPNPALPPEPSRATEVALFALTRLSADTPLDEVFRFACERAAAALGVERVGVWLFIDDDSALRCANLYERSKGEHSAGAILRVADFPKYFAALTIRKAVPAEVAASLPWTVELRDAYLTPLGISSMLDAGLFLDAKLVGVVCVEHVGPPRDWPTEARDFAAALADRLTIRLRSAEADELREAARTQLAEREKAGALEQFAAGVAHDLRNLLTVVMGVGELLQKGERATAEVRRQGGLLVEVAERGMKLAEQLTEYARPRFVPPAVTDLAALTADLMPALAVAVGPRHAVAFAPPPPLGRVLIDRTQFDRVLMNLVLNARDAMADGGTVRVRLASVKLSGDPAHTGRFVVLEVADTGVGMDEATRRRMFDPYFTTKATGTGLGLAVVRQIVARVGGLTRVESAPGKGTVIRVFFPNVGLPSGETREFTIPPELRV